MTKIKNINSLYTIKYDGDILLYKSTVIARPLFFALGCQPRFELPLNILLHYRRSSYFFFKTFKLCINRYYSDQKKLKPVTLRKILMLPGNGSKQFQQILDQIIQTNMLGEINLALAHIEASEIQQFYSGIHMQTSKSQKNLDPKVTTHQLPHVVSQAG